MKKIIIYTTPTCHYCKMVEDYLDKEGYLYQIKDVSGSNVENRKEMITKSGQMGVPVTIIGKEIIVGFNEEKLKAALK